MKATTPLAKGLHPLAHPRKLRSTASLRSVSSIGYWAATSLTAFAFAAGGAADLSRSPEVLEGMAYLGYPAYFATILGVWKVLGAAAILAPRMARLKEWAYAGMLFDLTGAAASHVASGDGAGKVITPLVILGIVAASWALRPASRTLRAPETEPEPRGALGQPDAPASIAV